MTYSIEKMYHNWVEYATWGGETYNAWQWISIGDIDNSRKWPAPDGFHVPSNSEWGALSNILTSTFSMISNYTTPGTYLKMPRAGKRNYNNADVEDVGNYGCFYWSSTPKNAGSAYAFYFDANYIMPQYNHKRSVGNPIRCFKDTPVIPTSSWTILYDGSSIATGAWIFWNSTDWLISVSGDGVTWYTIMDKNLGATTVFNQWDTATDANCWYFYQWWNNYWFAHSWTVSTSGTQVDASSYWPWNYYNSSIFITWNNDWSSVSNDDLWWDITGTISQENVISNTGVLSVNGQTWDVIIQTGGNYTAGTWIDITNDEIWLDGTYEWAIQDYSAMRWPCPEGFHIPLITEWQWLKTIMDWLGLTTSNNWRINLHMPFTGFRHYYSSNFAQQGSIGYYQSSSFDSTSKITILYLYWDDAVEADRIDYRADGISIRCFKDLYVAPTSSRTVINGTLWSAWIFWNQTDWLISITNGSTGYTIMDKNLWATTVYNNWDTLSEANSGKYYQWWNNYWFPFTWTVTTSSTRVNAGSYWPWNYYSSSTFITWNFDWSNTQNDNLRWWEIWIQTISASWNLVLWDKLYKIVISTSAPASWTTSNIITISTGSTKWLYVWTTKIA